MPIPRDNSRGHPGSPREIDSDTAGQTELTTPCRPFSHLKLQVRTSFCVDPEKLAQPECERFGCHGCGQRLPGRSRT